MAYWSGLVKGFGTTSGFRAGSKSSGIITHTYSQEVHNGHSKSLITYCRLVNNMEVASIYTLEGRGYAWVADIREAIESRANVVYTTIYENDEEIVVPNKITHIRDITLG